MNKSELVNAVAAKANISKADAKRAIDAAIEVVGDALAADDKVALIGFGTLATVKKEARQGINPRTKEAITIEARKAVKFKAGAELIAKVN